VHGGWSVAVEKEQQEYQRNRRLSGIDLSRQALKPGAPKEKVAYSTLPLITYSIEAQH